MGKSPAGSKAPAGANAAAAGGDDGESYNVPAAGLDPDSVQRVMKHLPESLREQANLGAATPEELSAQRAAYGKAVREARDAGRPGREELRGLPDDVKAAVTGQPVGDGKAEGAPSADDPDAAARDEAAADAEAAGQSKIVAAEQAPAEKASGPRRTAGPRKATTEGK